MLPARPVLASRRATRRSAPGVSACTATPAAVETVQLGKSSLRVPPVGIGAWSWGDRSGYWAQSSASGFGLEEARQAFAVCSRAGLTFIDTAEVYGQGLSEEYVGQFVRASGASRFQVATKVAPLPWRQTRGSVVEACKASLARLQLPAVQLYNQHWPGFAFNAWSNDAYLDGLSDCFAAGLTEAVGVSNFNAQRTRDAARTLAARGVPLSSNQVQYSLCYRAPERNGVLEACREAGVMLVAYSPLAQGLLTGKYSGSDAVKPAGIRSSVFTASRTQGLDSLLGLMREIGAAEGGKTPAQTAIAWCVAKGTLPIPGVKNARQAEEVVGALGWKMSAQAVADLDAASLRMGDIAFGAPFEKW